MNKSEIAPRNRSGGSSLIKKSVQTLLTASVMVTSVVPASAGADGVYFRYKQPTGWADGSIIGTPVSNPGGSLITPEPGEQIFTPKAPREVASFGHPLILSAELNQPYSAKLLSNLPEVTHWEHRVSEGELPSGLELNADAGTVEGTPDEVTPRPAKSVMYGYNIHGQPIIRAEVETNVYSVSPNVIRNETTIYTHIGQEINRTIPTNSDAVVRWEALVPLPTGLSIINGAIKGVVDAPIDAQVPIVGYDHNGRQVALTKANVIIDNKLQFDPIEDQIQKAGVTLSFPTSVTRSIGQVRYELMTKGSHIGTASVDAKTGTFTANVPLDNTDQQYQIRAVDIDGTVGVSNIFTLYTAEAPISLADITQLHTSIDRPYMRQLLADNVQGTVNWTVTEGSLPDGISLNPTTGLLSGRATTIGTSSGIVISATSTAGQSLQSQPFDFIVAAEALRASFETVDTRIGAQFVGTPLSITSGAVNPSSISLTSSVIPDALSDVIPDLQRKMVSGSIATGGDFVMPFNLTNGDGREIVVAQHFAVGKELSFTAPETLTFTRTKSATFSGGIIENNRGEYRVSMNPNSTGALPPGLSISSGGSIQGTPTAVGSYPNISLRVQDANGGEAVTANFTINVVERPDVQLTMSNTTIEWQRRYGYNMMPFTVENAVNGAKFRMISGTLPEGLKLHQDGYIYGSTTALPSTFDDFQVEVIDGEGNSTLSPTFSIKVVEAYDLSKPSAMNSNGEMTLKWVAGQAFEIDLPVAPNAEQPILFKDPNVDVSPVEEKAPARARSLMSVMSLGATQPEVSTARSAEPVRIVDGKLIGNVPKPGTYSVPYSMTDALGRKLEGVINLVILDPFTVKMPENRYLTTYIDESGDTVYQYNVPRFNSAVIQPTVTDAIGKTTTKIELKSKAKGVEAYSSHIQVKSSDLGQSTGVSTITVTDATGASVVKKFAINIIQEVGASLDYSIPADGVVGSASTAINTLKPDLQGTTTDRASYSASGLPHGLSLGYYSGEIYGTPSKAGVYDNVRVYAKSFGSNDWVASYGPTKFVVNPTGDIILPETTIIQARPNIDFSGTIRPDNTVAPINFYTATGSNLLAGVTLDSSTGTIAGVLSQKGLHSAGTVEVIDSFGRKKQTKLSIHVLDDMVLTPAAGVDSITSRQNVNLKPTVTNALGSVRYELAETSKALPRFFKLHPYTGAIEGFANEQGSWDGIVLKVTDSTGTVAFSKPFTVAVTQRPELSTYTSSDLSFTTDSTKKVTLLGRNVIGKAEYTISGKLPDGITFNPVTNVISGRANEIGEFPITITIKDAQDRVGVSSQHVIKTTLRGNAGLTIPAMNGAINYDYASPTPVPTNTVGELTFTADQGLADNGFKIDAKTGIITSITTPKVPITFDTVITVSDSLGRKSSATHKVNILGELMVTFVDLFEIQYGTNAASFSPKAGVLNPNGTVTAEVVGTLPLGMSLSASTRGFQNSPIELGDFPVIIRITESAGYKRTADVKTVVRVTTDNKIPTGSITFPLQGTPFNTPSVTYSGTFTNIKTGTTLELAPDSKPLAPGFAIIKNGSSFNIQRKTAGSIEDIGIYDGIKFILMSPDGLSSEIGPYTMLVTGKPYKFPDIVVDQTKFGETFTVSPTLPTEPGAGPTGVIQYSIASAPTGNIFNQISFNQETGELTGQMEQSGAVAIRANELSPIDGKTVINSSLFYVRVQLPKTSIELKPTSSFMLLQGITPAQYYYPTIKNPRDEYSLEMKTNVAGISLDQENGVFIGEANASATSNGTTSFIYRDSHQTLTSSINNTIMFGTAESGRGFKHVKIHNPTNVPIQLGSFRLTKINVSSHYDLSPYLDGFYDQSLAQLFATAGEKLVLQPNEAISMEIAAPLDLMWLSGSPSSSNLKLSVSVDGDEWLDSTNFTDGAWHRFEWWDRELFKYDSSVELNRPMINTTYNSINFTDLVDTDSIKEGFALESIKWDVTGLPSGMTHKNGQISGTTSRSGTYTLNITGTVGIAKFSTVRQLIVDAPIDGKYYEALNGGVLKPVAYLEPYSVSLLDYFEPTDKRIPAKPTTHSLASQSYANSVNLIQPGETYGLPTGLTFNAATGEISGTPITSGNYRLVIFVGNNQYIPLSLAVTGGAPSVIQKYTQISIGEYNGCGINIEGNVECWGRKDGGALGDALGGSGNSPTPVSVAGVPLSLTAVNLHVGEVDRCATYDDGSAWCWGTSTGMANVDRTYAQQIKKADGTAILGITKTNSIGSHLCALNNDGLWCAGSNTYGQSNPAGTSTSTVPNFVLAVANTSEFTIADFSTGDQSTCILSDEGAVKCFGSRANGRIGVGNTFTGNERNITTAPLTFAGGIKSIDQGEHHACALSEEGNVTCWGMSDFNQGGISTNPGTLTPVTGIPSPVKQLVSGNKHNCALTVDEEVYCWGWQRWGQIGINTVANSFQAPTLLPSLTGKVKQIAAGYSNTCAILKDGQKTCWGRNTYAELGDPTAPNSLRMTPVLPN